MLSEDEVARLAEALAAHRFVPNGCACGWSIPGNVPMLPTYEAHQALALAPVVEEIARARAEAAVSSPYTAPMERRALAAHAPQDGAQAGADGLEQGSEGERRGTGGEGL